MFPKALRREILIYLGVKALLLIVLYELFFSSVQQLRPENLLTHILGN